MTTGVHKAHQRSTANTHTVRQPSNALITPQIKLLKILNQVIIFTYILFKSKAERRLQWSRGSVLCLGTRARGFKPGRSRQYLAGRKNPQHAFLRRGSKAVGPMS